MKNDEINLLAWLVILAKHKKLVLGLPFVLALLAVVISLLLPNIYTGTSKILVSQSDKGASALLSQLSGMPIGSGSGLSGALKNPSDLYVDMLKSRTVADNIIQQFDLNQVYDQELQSNTRKHLESVTNIKGAKDSVITIEVDDEDPKRAAALANAYVGELFKLTTVLAVTEASKRRLFFERQAMLAKDNLVKAEAAAKRVLEQGGLVGVEAKGRTKLETLAGLQAAISAKEVEIGNMRIFASDGNAKLKRAQQELEVMKRELAKGEGAGGNPTGDLGSESDTGINNLGLLRDVKYYQTMYDLIVQQLNLAKVEEAKDSAIVQIIDKAIEPDRKSKPKRALIVVLWASLGLFIGIWGAFLCERLGKGNSERTRLLLELKRYLDWK